MAAVAALGIAGHHTDAVHRYRPDTPLVGFLQPTARSFCPRPAIPASSDTSPATSVTDAPNDAVAMLASSFDLICLTISRLIRLTKGDDRNSNHATTPPAQSRSFFWSSNERATNAEASAASSAASAAEPPAEQEQPPSAAPKPPTPAPEPTFTPPDPPQHPPLRAPQPFLVTPPSERSRSHRNRHSSDSHPSIPTNRLRRDHFPFRPRGGCGGSSGPGRLSGTIAASVTASNQTQTRGAALRRALQEQAAERRRRLLEEEMVLSRALSGVTMRKRGGFAWRPGMEVVIKGAATGNGDVAETGRERMVQERMERQQRMVAKRGGMISGGGGFLRGEVGGY